MPDASAITELYASVTRPAPEFLSTLERWLQCRRLALFSADRKLRTCGLLASNDSHFSQLPVLPTWPEGAFCLVDQQRIYLSVREQQDLLKGLVVEFDSNAQAEKTYDALIEQSSAQSRLLDRLVQATALFLRLHEGTLARQALLAVLESYPCPLVVLNARREPVFVNHAGHTLPHLLNGFQLTSNGLRLPQEADHLRLQRHLKNLVTRQLLNVDQPDSVLTFEFAGQTVPVLLTTHQPQHWRGGLAPSDFLLWTYWMPPQLVPDLPLSQLKLAFNLSQTEAELALFLFQAGTLKHYAQQRGVSEYTARKQLQAVLHKTASRTQEDLMITLFQQRVFC